MMYATKIRMRPGCSSSYDCKNIEAIYLKGAQSEQYYAKAALYDWLIANPYTIRVNLGNMPYVIPARSSNGEKYVRSEPNDTIYDNLLYLPRG